MAALAVVRDIRSPRSLETDDDAGAYQENLLAEFVLARSAHGVVDATVRGDLAAIEEFLAYSGVWAWEVEPAHADRFLSVAQRDKAARTRQIKAQRIATFYRFLESRYQGELAELTGKIVTSPIDTVNRPVHGGDFSVRVPPSAPDLAAFFSYWRSELETARKWRTAARTYTMARVTAEVGLRAAELCGLRLDDCHFDHGPLGKIHVRLGKGGQRFGPTRATGPHARHGALNARVVGAVGSSPLASSSGTRFAVLTRSRKLGAPLRESYIISFDHRKSLYQDVLLIGHHAAPSRIDLRVDCRQKLRIEFRCFAESIQVYITEPAPIFEVMPLRNDEFSAWAAMTMQLREQGNIPVQ